MRHGQPSKDVGKGQSKNNNTNTRVLLKQNKEKRVLEVSDRGRIWCFKKCIYSGILVYFFYRNYKITSHCSRLYENLSIRHLGRIGCEKYMRLDGVLSGNFVQVPASVWG